MDLMADDLSTRSGSVVRRDAGLERGVLRVLDGPGRGQRVPIGDVPLVVGRGEGCDLRLDDRRVSREHCRITLGRYGYAVTDLGSQNGTIFEGSRVGEITVAPGAILRIGDTHVVLAGESDRDGIAPLAVDRFGELWGKSLVMRRAFAVMELAAASKATVLLGGETGTGKELAAHAIHAASPRRDGPFEVFDCGAVVPSLLASELFGHSRGAFTGAETDRRGVFARAHGGTLFLDEIGELPLELQPSLLRACESGRVQVVGGGAESVDVRVIAATRRDLPEEVAAGRFREDLYYRLNIVTIMLPPLRARREDLSGLVARLLAELGATAPGPIDGPNLALLNAHAWPGNVRELRNTLERALVRAGLDAPFSALGLELAAAGYAERGAGSFQDGKRDAVARFEREYLVGLMRDHGGNLRRAARASGIERTQLRRLLRKNGLV